MVVNACLCQSFPECVQIRLGVLHLIDHGVARVDPNDDVRLRGQSRYRQQCLAKYRRAGHCGVDLCARESLSLSLSLSLSVYVCVCVCVFMCDCFVLCVESFLSLPTAAGAAVLLNRTKQNKAKQSKTRQNKTKQNNEID